MRVLVLCTDAWGGHGGIALYTRDLVGAIAAHPDCEEVVVLPRVVRGAIDGVPAKVRFIDSAARGNAAFVRTLARVMRGERFDVVICAHINLLPLLRWTSAKPVLFVYGIEAWRPPKRKLVTSFSGLRAVVSISEVTLRRFLDWSSVAAPSFLLPNAIHAEEYRVQPAKPAALVERYGIGARKVLLTVGRLNSAERYKGFEEVMEVLPTFPDTVYVIAGDGDDRPRLEAKAKQLGVADRVIFTGLFPDSLKADLYALADAYVMPSRGEGFGFVFLEAMACGTPVVGGKHDGGREALADGALGLLVDPTSPAEVRAGIAEALMRPRVVPDGLDAFSYARFTERVHAILGDLA